MGAAITVAAVVALAYVIQQSQQASDGTTPATGDWYTGTALESVVAVVTGRLTAAEIASYAAAAGFQGDDLVTAVAVALAESGGNQNAYNPETAAGTPEGFGSFGLWQVYLKAHPEFVGIDLYDPQTNANAAFQVYSAAGGRFTPWSTFKNGAYLARLSKAQAGVAGAQST